MTRCDRLEREGWLGPGHGPEDDDARAHMDGCPDCQELWRKHQRIEAALARVGEGHAPSPEARARLAAALDGERFRRPRPRRWAVLGVPAALAAAAALLLFLRSGPQLPGRAALHVELVPGDSAPRRTSMPRIGDHVRVRATLGGAAHAALRVYRNRDRLLLACPDAPDPRCEAGEHALSAQFRLDAVGTHEVLLLTSDAPLPAVAPGASIDQVIVDAAAAGADHQLHDIEVQ